MSKALPEPSQALATKVAERERATNARTFSLKYDHRRLIIKQAAPQGRGRLQAWLVGWLCKRLTGVRLSKDALLLPGGQRQLEFEAQRLQSLRKAGEAVPAVCAVGDGWLALEDVGQNLQHRLNTLSADQTLDLLQTLATDLADFHQAGHWHGGSQIRNLTMRNDQLFRIDFEEDLSSLPRPLVQAYDLALFLSSCIQPLDRIEADVIAAGQTLLEEYFRAHPSSEVLHCLQQGYNMLKWLQRPLRLLGGWAGRDGERLRLLLEILSGFLVSPQAEPA